MATTANNQGIKNSMSFMAFASNFKKVSLGDFANKQTGEMFKSLIFTDATGNNTFVSFSSKLGELTPHQIAAQKNELQIVELESGSLKLCKQGESTWQEIDLGL